MNAYGRECGVMMGYSDDVDGKMIVQDTDKKARRVKRLW
jgi:hypothetical protein